VLAGGQARDSFGGLCFAEAGSYLKVSGGTEPIRREGFGRLPDSNWSPADSVAGRRRSGARHKRCSLRMRVLCRCGGPVWDAQRISPWCLEVLTLVNYSAFARRGHHQFASRFGQADSVNGILAIGYFILGGNRAAPFAAGFTCKSLNALDLALRRV